MQNQARRIELEEKQEPRDRKDRRERDLRGEKAEPPPKPGLVHLNEEQLNALNSSIKNLAEEVQDRS